MNVMRPLASPASPAREFHVTPQTSTQRTASPCATVAWMATRSTAAAPPGDCLQKGGTRGAACSMIAPPHYLDTLSFAARRRRSSSTAHRTGQRLNALGVAPSCARLSSTVERMNTSGAGSARAVTPGTRAASSSGSPSRQLSQGRARSSLVGDGYPSRRSSHTIDREKRAPVCRYRAKFCPAPGRSGCAGAGEVSARGTSRPRVETGGGRQRRRRAKSRKEAIMAPYDRFLQRANRARDRARGEGGRRPHHRTVPRRWR